MKLKKLIINADDFGLTEGNTIGIVLCHADGILTSTTLMINLPYAPLACELAKAHPTLGVGIHLTLTQGAPVLTTGTSFTDENGNFRKQSTYQKDFSDVNQDELYAEWKAQIEKFIDMMGKKPTHIDSHHHVHSRANNLPVAMRLAKEYDLPMRLYKDVSIEGYEYDYQQVTHCAGYYEDTATPNYFKTNDFGLWDEEIHEVMCHPGFIDQRLLDISSYAVGRANEMAVLRCQEVKDWIKENNIELITFADLEKITKEPIEKEEESILDKISEVVDDVKEEISEVIDDIKEEVTEVIDDIKDDNVIEEILEKIVDED